MKLLSCFLLLLVATPLSAQEDQVDWYSLSLEDLKNVKVFGSTLTDETIKTVPAAVSVFTHEQIQRMGFDYLHELLNLIPGYQSQRTADF